jgi:hypothetical protein
VVDAPRTRGEDTATGLTPAAPSGLDAVEATAAGPRGDTGEGSDLPDAVAEPALRGVPVALAAASLRNAHTFLTGEGPATYHTHEDALKTDPQ